MRDDEAKLLILIVAAVILFAIVVSSPVGDLIFDILAFIPGIIWQWLFGIAALIGLVALIRYLMGA